MDVGFGDTEPAAGGAVSGSIGVALPPGSTGVVCSGCCGGAIGSDIWLSLAVDGTSGGVRSGVLSGVVSSEQADGLMRHNHCHSATRPTIILHLKQSMIVHHCCFDYIASIVPSSSYAHPHRALRTLGTHTSVDTIACMNARLRLLLMMLSCAACGGDDSSDPGKTVADPDAATSCADISGNWVIRSHCGAALVGMSVTVTQTGCSITTSGSFPGFTGTLKSDGKFSMSGTASGMSVSCEGTATAQQISETCTGNCSVTLGR